jgi:hypothetical protein
MIRVRLGDPGPARDSLASMPPFMRLARLGGQSLVAELMEALGDAESAAGLHERLKPWARRYTIFIGCEGSWSRPLGLLAATCGRWDEARRHFEDAIALNQKIGARPWVAQSQVDYANMLLRTGNERDRARAAELQAQARALAEELGMPGMLALLPERADGPAATPARAPAPTRDLAEAFRLEGEYWTISHAGQTFRLKDTKGLQLVAHLLHHPGQEFHVLHLAGVTSEADQVLVEGDIGPELDASAKASYKERLEELRETLREAEEFGDGDRAARAREELDFLAQELARGVGLGGRDRKAPAHVERARINLQRRISDALKKIEQACPALGRQLGRAIRTGTYCSYDPA